VSQEIEHCTFRLKNKLKNGHCVAVSPHLAMTSLHGAFEVGSPFIIVSKSGVERNGAVFITVFESRKVDIALVRLIDGEPLFQRWLGVLDRPPKVFETAAVAYLRDCTVDDDTPPYDFDAQSMQIFGVGSASTLCRAQYYTTDGMSGCPVVSEIQRDGSCRLIGVHVASDDSTEEAPPVKKSKSGQVDADSVSECSSSHSRHIHGHTAYARICVAHRVPEIVSAILVDTTSTVASSHPVS
jgi:hypothetical protein